MCSAKITLRDALQHLHHFCNTLPATAHTVFAPIFTFDHAANESVSCRVILPNSVDSSAREFCSTGLWSTERWARMDAAFEAYVGLYRVGLINDNLLPLSTYDEDAAKAYAEVAKRPAITAINAKFNPWPAVAATWQSTMTVYLSTIRISSGVTEIIRMNMISPCRLPQLIDLTLYVNARTLLRVEIGEGVRRVKDEVSVATANEITKVLLTSVFPTRMKEADGGFPLLFTPTEEVGDPQSWLEHVRGTHDSSDILSGVEDAAAVGIVRDHSKSGKAYIFHGADQTGQVPLADMRLKAKKFPKRTDFLHRVPADITEKKDDFVFLDPENCRIERMPVIYAQFATYIPSIMHHVENALLTDHLHNGVLAPIRFSSQAAVFPAICAPAAREDGDYQRLEFLGDSILKMLTSTTLMADHQTWHEGYLSRAKDHIVSNGRLAMAAQETELDKYILTRAFTGKKWKPLSNMRLGMPQTIQHRKISTKTLADVVEALVGAAFLDGGFTKALSCLRVFLPEVSWLPLAERNIMLLRTACDSPQLLTTPSNFANLETLVGHTFACKRLLLEAITHPSHLSIPSTPSYQRLEYLGDAILDYLVTTTIFSYGDRSQKTLQPLRMHTLRASAVNASFLAFRSLSRTVSISIAEIASPAPKEAPLLVPSTRPISLPQFLRYAPIPALNSALNATRDRFAALETAINAAFSHSLVYPWRALATFAPEKVFSDMIEAVLGAVYVDTSGDLKSCEALLARFGILDWVETALRREVRILHPKEELGVVAGNEKVRYQVWIEKAEDCLTVPVEELVVNASEEESLVFGKGRYRCKVFVGEEEICSVQGWNRIEVETAAATEAVRILEAK